MKKRHANLVIVTAHTELAVLVAATAVDYFTPGFKTVCKLKIQIMYLSRKIIPPMTIKATVIAAMATGTILQIKCGLFAVVVLPTFGMNIT